MPKTLLASLPVRKQKFGWPWTEEVDSAVYCATQKWPKISIVLPSYNQGHFIEESIRSVLLQNYPNLELIIIDGGSTDSTLKIIEEYNPWITYWESERDKGQANAINKGLNNASGAIFNWLNTDDLLAPLCLISIKDLFHKEHLLAGQVLNFNQADKNIHYIQNSNLSISNLLKLSCSFHQPGIWHRLTSSPTSIHHPEQYSYYFDKIFYIQHSNNRPINLYTEKILIYFRLHNQSKTNTIRTSNIDEIIFFYRKIVTNKEYKKYQKEAQLGLKNQLLPEKIITNWQKHYKSSSLAIRIISYLKIPLKNPSILKTRFYYIFLKKI